MNHSVGVGGLMAAIFVFPILSLFFFLLLLKYKLMRHEMELVKEVVSHLPQHVQAQMYHLAERLRKETIWDKIVAFLSNLPLASDLRLKSNVEPMDNALEMVRKLKIVSFNYNRWSLRDERTRRIGLIAQDLVDIMPEAVKKGRLGFLRVEYSCLVALLLKSIIELDRKVESVVQSRTGSGADL